MFKLLKRIFSKKTITLDEYIDSQLKKGESKEHLQERLLKDLNGNGPIFKEFRDNIKPTVKSSKLEIGEWVEINGKPAYRWSAVMIDTCLDCLERHNQVKTWQDWEKIGLPRTGKTRCKKNCKCVLLPERTTTHRP